MASMGVNTEAMAVIRTIVSALTLRLVYIRSAYASAIIASIGIYLLYGMRGDLVSGLAKLTLLLILFSTG